MGTAPPFIGIRDPREAKGAGRDRTGCPAELCSGGQIPLDKVPLGIQRLVNHIALAVYAQPIDANFLRRRGKIGFSDIVTQRFQHGFRPQGAVIQRHIPLGKRASEAEGSHAAFQTPVDIMQSTAVKGHLILPVQFFKDQKFALGQLCCFGCAISRFLDEICKCSKYVVIYYMDSWF